MAIYPDQIIFRLVILYLLLPLQTILWAQQSFNVKDYGASGDAATKDTEYIQQAIDAAAGNGTGIVYFPPGRYLSGTLLMKSGVTLYLEKGAVLLGSVDLDDFPITRPSLRSYTDNYVNRSLVYGENLRNIAIVGRGTIDGQGASFTDSSYLIRPYLIRFIKCHDVLVEGITLRDSPMWVQHYLGCDFVRLTGLTVHSQVNRNNDMLDIDGCHNVVISDCFADTEDDAITLKSTFSRTTENVVVTNCVLSSQCSAIKLGTESNGGFRNISISNCVIDSSYVEKPGYLDREMGSSGISLLMVDGGSLENVVISDIAIRGVSVPLFLRLGNRARPFRENMAKPGVGSFRGVSLSNITAQDVGVLGSSITGLPGSEIENVTLSNIRITYPGGGLADDAGRAIPELEAEYPAAAMFGRLPAWGFYCRHVKGLRLDGIDLSLESKDERPAIVFEDVHQLDVSETSIVKTNPSEFPALILRDVSSALISGCRIWPNTDSFLLLEGQSKGVGAVANQLLDPDSQIHFGRGVPRNALHLSGSGQN